MLRRHQFVIGGIAIVLLAGAVLFSATGLDDSFITYWSAYALATFGKIVNLNGHAIEQSSSLLFVLLLAGLFKLTAIDLSTLGALTSLVFAGVAVVSTGRLARRIAPELHPYAVLLTASSLPLVFWAYAGSEQTTFVSLVLAWLLRIATILEAPRPRWVGFGVITACLLLVRPETPFLMIAVLIGLALAVRLGRIATEISLRRVAIMLGATLAGFAILVAIRHVLFGASFPLPVTAKMGGATGDRLVEGSSYLVQNYRSIAIVVLSLFGIVQAIRRRIEVVLALAALVLVIELGFIIAAGGDWMPWERFMLNLLPFAIVCGLDAARTLGRRWLQGVAIAIAIVNVWSWVAILRGAERPPGRPFWVATSTPSDELDALPWFVSHNRLYVRDFEFAKRLAPFVERLAAAHHREVRVLGEHAGSVMYLLQRDPATRVRFYDRRAITTRDFLDCAATKDLPRRSIGLDVTYEDLFAKQPDIEACGIPMPDIIQDLDHDNVARYWKPALANGYIVALHLAPPDGRGFYVTALIRAEDRALVADLLPPL